MDVIGTSFVGVPEYIYKRGVETARQLLGDSEFGRAYAQGQAMTLEEAMLLIEEAHTHGE
jgi:hypothetical protein